MAFLLDQARQFEEWRELLPMLKGDLKRGATAKEIREKYSAFLQARQVSIALTTDDVAKADAAINKIIDRVEGKATEKREVTHQFAELTDEQLDAIIYSEQDDLLEDSANDSDTVN